MNFRSGRLLFRLVIGWEAMAATWAAARRKSNKLRTRSWQFNDTSALFAFYLFDQCECAPDTIERDRSHPPAGVFNYSQDYKDFKVINLCHGRWRRTSDAGMSKKDAASWRKHNVQSGSDNGPAAHGNNAAPRCICIDNGVTYPEPLTRKRSGTRRNAISVLTESAAETTLFPLMAICTGNNVCESVRCPFISSATIKYSLGSVLSKHTGA